MRILGICNQLDREILVIVHSQLEFDKAVWILLEIWFP